MVHSKRTGVGAIAPNNIFDSKQTTSMDHGDGLVGEPTDEATTRDETRSRAQTLPLVLFFLLASCRHCLLQGLSSCEKQTTPAGNVDADGDECIASDDPPIDPVLASALEQLVIKPKRPLSEILFEMRGR